MAGWAIAIILGAYCVSLHQDAKRTYLLNSVILRNLHEETLRADANGERLKHSTDVIKHLYKTNPQKLKVKSDANSPIADYEVELAKRNAESELTHERNKALVEELFRQRQKNLLLEQEIKKLRST